MIIKGKDGIYRVTRTDYCGLGLSKETAEELEARQIDRMNKKYGEGNWIYTDDICHSLSPQCGYGEPMNKNNCTYCTGKCVRPRRENK